MSRSLGAALAAVVLLSTGCGGSSDSETSATDEWANDLCSAIQTWKTSIVSSADSLKGGNISKESLQSAADDAKSATETLTGDLKGLGKPDTESGQQAKDSVDQLSSELENGMDTIETAVDDASGVSGVLNAVSVIGTTAATMQSQVSSTFDELDQLGAQGELQSAFQQSSACSGLGRSSS